MEGGPKSSRCDICAEQFPSRSKLFAHLRAAHGGEVGTVASVDSAVDLTKLQTAYEDDVCKVIVKPQGLSTMGHKGLTVWTHPDLRLVDCSRVKATPCHRLDKETGGLLICSKDKRYETIICQCFRLKWVQKKYIAIAMGRLEPAEGEFTSDIKGKASRTRYRVVSYDRSVGCDWITTVELWPISGRRHQLRKHLAQAGHPILGDRRYSHAATWPKESKNMFLWAVELSLPHPMQLRGLFDRFGLYGVQTLGKRPRPADDEPASIAAVENATGVAAGGTAGAIAGGTAGAVSDPVGDIDDNDDDDEGAAEDEDEGADAADVSEEILTALQDVPCLVLSIPEPPAYELLRQYRRQEFNRSDAQVPSQQLPLTESSA